MCTLKRWPGFLEGFHCTSILGNGCNVSLYHRNIRKCLLEYYEFLGFWKNWTLSSSLDRERNHKAKSYKEQIKNVFLVAHVHSKSTFHINKARCAAQMLDGLILLHMCFAVAVCACTVTCVVGSEHQLQGSGKQASTCYSNFSCSQSSLLSCTKLFPLLNLAGPEEGSSPSITVKLCSV